MAGGLRFVPYVGAALGAVLPTLIAFAVTPGWVQPFLVLGWIVACDLIIGQIVEPLLFGEFDRRHAAGAHHVGVFWGTLWGPVGLLLSTPLAICLLVLGRHVPHLGFLQILLGDEPALAPYQQIYRRLIRKAVADASTVALAEIEEKGRGAGARRRHGPHGRAGRSGPCAGPAERAQVEAIVEGTDEVLDFLAADAIDGELAAPAAADAAARELQRRLPLRRRPRADRRRRGRDRRLRLAPVGPRGQRASRRGDKLADGDKAASVAIDLICYASHPSDAVRRYTLRKLTLGGGAGRARHARHRLRRGARAVRRRSPAPRDRGDTFAGDLATLCRLAAQHAVTVGCSLGSVTAS